MRANAGEPQTIQVDDIAFLGDEFRPAKPANIQTVVQGGDVVITWSERPEPDVVGYNVYRRLPLENLFTKLNSALVMETRYTDAGAASGGYVYTVQAVDMDGNESDLYWTVHHEIPYIPKETYSSAASARMILDYLGNSISETAIYDYGHAFNLPGNQGSGTQLDPNGMDMALGHFDPYDAAINDPYNFGDSFPDGNPYQGYNYVVESYDASQMTEYMRDIAHWMDYPVSVYVGASEYTVPAKVPPAVPIAGSYDKWVVVNGVTASDDPLPNETNPWFTPEFTVFGFWLSDPNTSGIGANQGVTAEAAIDDYFFPLTTGDPYNGKLVQVAEPPPREA